ncbi:hypothetical protein BZG36_01037 [Bifiguratus adelaidae]|uniref:Major facilitator superfamily (MFS) profile domain-containing protein n=1 Tax=Bifiguratus adelaidae TaxID=1938954 RepID=A0A261Y6B7_9FUNG|nr:hypothetical protein BZG36_01037 [Bifiguratus adelaidae]
MSASEHSEHSVSEGSTHAKEHTYTHEHDEAGLPPRRKWLTVAAMLGAISGLNGTIVNTALLSIARDFDAVSSMAWISIINFLANTVSQPLYGKVSDIVGRRWPMTVAMILFLVGSIMCALSNGIILMVIARFIQGLGGGGIMSLSSVILSDIIPATSISTYQSSLASVFSIASVIGPVLGGVFTESLNWRWCFYIAIIVGGINLVVFVVGFQDVMEKRAKRLQDVDFWGAALFTASIILLLFGLSMGGTQFSWSSAPIISFLVVGMILLIAFVVVEARFAIDPIVSGTILRNRAPFFGFIGTIAAAFAMFAGMLYLPTYLQLVKAESPAMAGVDILPLGAALGISGFLCGFWLSRTRTFILTASAGSICIVIGFALISILDPASGEAIQIVALVVSGVGFGLVMAPLQLSAQLSVSKSEQAMTITLISFARQLGGVLGTGICSAVYNQQLLVLADRLLGDQGRSIIMTFQNSRDYRNVNATVQGIFNTALGLVFQISAGVAGAGLLASLAMSSRFPWKRRPESQDK